MKFICTIEIEAPLDLVVQIFHDPLQQKFFQDGFISKEHISGNINSKNAKSKMIYKNLELIETIIENNYPYQFKALYEHKHMINTMDVTFSSIHVNKTLYTSEIEYIKFNNLFIKVLSKLLPGIFKKQVQKWLNQFKNYVEIQNAKINSQG